METEGSGPADSASDLAVFLLSLVNDGRAAISAHPNQSDDADALPLLQQLDSIAREELALQLPALSPAAALWGARLCHQLCRFVVLRDIGEDQIQAVCAVPCPETRSPQTDWSVDLTLHHLPRLFQLARQLANADPLIIHMKQIAATWPLSSAGIHELENMQLEQVKRDPSLLRLYADRLTAAGDTSRLGDPIVDDLLRSDLGIHHQLAPALAEKLFKPCHDTH